MQQDLLPIILNLQPVMGPFNLSMSLLAQRESGFLGVKMQALVDWKIPSQGDRLPFLYDRNNLIAIDS